MISLAELSILRNHVSTCQLLAYYKAELGSPYEAYEMLKQSRAEYSQECVAFVEQILDNQLDSQCKECENVATEAREPIGVNTRILLEKMR